MEGREHAERLGPGHGAERPGSALRRHHGDTSSGPDPETGGQPVAEHHAGGIAERIQRPGPQIVRDNRERVQVFRPDSARKRARGVALADDHRLPFDCRMGAYHAFDRPHLPGQLVEIVERAAVYRHHRDMAVQAQYTVEQLGAEAVHHRHHDDQRRDAERNTDQRDDRGQRDEPFLPPRAQIAERDGALERRKHQASRANADSSEISSRSPVARHLSSTLPLSRPRGPTITCQGRPIRSMSANFTPARSERSS